MQVLDRMELYNDDTRHGFEHTLGWLRQWACSRSFGLGTWRAPTRSLCCSSFPHDLAPPQAGHLSVGRSPASEFTSHQGCSTRAAIGLPRCMCSSKCSRGSALPLLCGSGSAVGCRLQLHRRGAVLVGHH